MPAPIHAFDSSAVVAALLSWHERHEAAREAVERAFDGGGRPILPVHALVESYAVLTRLPAPHRLSPADAAEILERSFAGAVEMGGFDSGASWFFLGDLAMRDVHGGRAYDELILASALAAGATRLVTLNPRHFDADRIEIVVPGPAPEAR
jgi:predicted nucleic acid-binding protein